MCDPSTTHHGAAKRSVSFAEGVSAAAPAAAAATDSAALSEAAVAATAATTELDEVRATQRHRTASSADTTSRMLASPSIMSKHYPVLKPTPHPPAVSRLPVTAPAAVDATALRHAPTLAPPSLLSELFEDPLFQLVSPSASIRRSPTSAASAATTPTTAAAAAAGLPRRLNFSSTAVLPSAAAAGDAPVHTATEGTIDFSTAATAKVSVLAPTPSLTSLPSSRAPPPKMLLVAFADMDVLQQSFYAHTCLWTAREQLLEFKRLVAASMKAELVSERFLKRPSRGSKAEMGETSDGTTATTHDAKNTTAEDGAPHTAQDAMSDVAAPAASCASAAMQTHDVALRSALRAAHGFLYGLESTPTGVPQAHLHRARRQWIAEYGQQHVRARLACTQRRRYDQWRLQQQRERKEKDRVASAHAGAAEDSREEDLRLSPPLPPSISLSPIPAPTAAAPARKRQAGFHGTPAFASPSISNNNSATATSRPAVWEIDLYDDLQLMVAADQRDALANQAESRTAVEAVDNVTHAPSPLHPSSTLPGNNVNRGSSARQRSSSGATAAAMAPPNDLLEGTLLGRLPPDLTQMQLPLPTFVYVLSRYLFLAHYTPYFPAGLFCPPLLDSSYFAEPAQCTAGYAMRAVRQLRRAALTAYAEYASQLLDAHRCFPERISHTEVPLPAHDNMHVWELLCPPQRQDRAGHWQPVPWGPLSLEEEEALLQEEYVHEEDEAASGATAPTRLRRSHVAPPAKDRPLLSFAYARRARRVYREHLQQLARHPRIIEEVRRLFAICEDVALRFFLSVDVEQRGCISWESFTDALIEEADIHDHQLKVREHAVRLTHASASVFDRYAVEPLAAALVRLGYTENVLEVRHSGSLVVLEGPTDYAVCDGTQLGSIHQRLLVRPVEVVLKELETVLRDAFGRPFRMRDAVLDRAGDGTGENGGSSGSGGHGGGRSSGSSTVPLNGFDAELQLRPWRHNQQQPLVFIPYEDARRLQEVTALSVLQQLSNASSGGVSGNDRGKKDYVDSEAEAAAASAVSAAAAAMARLQHSMKPVLLEAVLAVEEVSPRVPITVYVARSNDMLLRLYSSTVAVQALPEAALLRCAETVTCMEWAAGGTHGKSRAAASDSLLGPFQTRGASAAADTASSNTAATSSSASVHGAATTTAQQQQQRRRNPCSTLSVQSQAYLLLGTRSGVLCLVDLRAVMERVPRLVNPSFAPLDNERADSRFSMGGGGSAGEAGHVTLQGRNATGAMSSSGLGCVTSERIGTSEDAWSGYRSLARRTYYNDIAPFVLHRRQVHTPGTSVSSIVAAASNGLFVSSGLDGDVFTLRLGVTSNELADVGLEATAHGERPPVRMEVLHRLAVGEAGVRYALPVPSVSMTAVLTVTNKVLLYHTSVANTTNFAMNSWRTGSGNATAATASATSSDAAFSNVAGQHHANVNLSASPSSPSSSSTRLELYDAAAPHLGSIVAVMAVEELDQLLTVDSSGYVKVWSLRQAHQLTSFYALAPMHRGDGGNSGGAGDGNANWTSTRVASGTSGAGAEVRPCKDTARNSGAAAASASAGGVGGADSSLLRVTKNSIEAAVKASECRLQACLSAAYNYTAKQLFVLGTDNAALCFFMSGQASARAHTHPVQVLLIDTSAKIGHVHRRLISVSSADCRVWSLLNGAMELGIRASNPEYRELFNHRLTGNTQGSKTDQSTAEGTDGSNANYVQHRGGSSGSSGRHRTHTRPPIASASAAAQLDAAASTTGEARRLLPPSVGDVMRAMSAQRSISSSSARQRGHNSSSRTASVQQATASSVRPATFKSAAFATPPSTPLNSRIGIRAFASTNADGDDAASGGEGALLLPGALRDHNVLTSDIRCACLGPDGQWVGYGLLHGDIRLHRSDSGRLLHTFITTPPSQAELIQAAMQYEHLFQLAGDVDTAMTGAASAPSTPRTGFDGTANTARLPAANAGLHASPTSHGSTRTHHRPAPTAKVTAVAYAQAVAAVLQQLVSAASAGQRFRSFSRSSEGPTSTHSSTGKTASSSVASAIAGGVIDLGNRNVHREPLHMFYWDSSQELWVVYADGLVRVFTSVGHRTTATRVIVSRTLMDRALEQVRRLMRNSQYPLSHRGGASVSSSDTTAAAIRRTASRMQLRALLGEGDSPGEIPAKPLLLNNASTAASNTLTAGRGGLRSWSRESRDGTQATATGTTTAESVATRAATSPSPLRKHESFRLTDAALQLSSAAKTEPQRAAPGALPSSASQAPPAIEPDVVLLATASPPLGLICLVHANGLVTVMDVQDVHHNHADRGGGGSSGVWTTAGGGDANGGAEETLDTGSGLNGGAGSEAISDATGGFTRTQAGVVVHSFMTTDEVTAAAFLGAYPCLVLADRQLKLSFHLMKGATMVALLGDLAERLNEEAALLPQTSGAREPSFYRNRPYQPHSIGPKVSDATERGDGAAASLGRFPTRQLPAHVVSPGKGTRPLSSLPSPTSASSATLMWSTWVAHTCATSHAIGSVTALTFDPLYATVYVGTSQGYVLSYLVRRLLLAFQLTPVYLRGVSTVSVSAYASELQRRTDGPAAPPPQQSTHTQATTTSSEANVEQYPGSGQKPTHHHEQQRHGTTDFLCNLLQVVFGVSPAVVTERLRDVEALPVTVSGNDDPRRRSSSTSSTTRPELFSRPSMTSSTVRDADTAAVPTSFLGYRKALLDLYEAQQHVLSRDNSDVSGLGKAAQRDFNSSATIAPSAAAVAATTPPLLFSHYESPTSLYVAAAVLHDAVTRMVAASAAAANHSKTSDSSAKSKPIREDAAAQDTQPWWSAVSGGGLVCEYVTRQCTDATELLMQLERTGAGLTTPMHITEDAAPQSGESPRATSSHLELDAAGVSLLREWIRTALTQQSEYGDLGESKTPAHQNPLASAAPARRRSSVHSSHNSSFRGCTDANATLPPHSGSLPVSRHNSYCYMRRGTHTQAGNDSVTARDRNASGAQAQDAQLNNATAQSLADTIVQEVQEELLFGETAVMAVFQDDLPPAATTTAAPAGARTGPSSHHAPSHQQYASPSHSGPNGNMPAEHRHPITDAWVEPLFTRQVMAMTSRSPLCLLTPPAMLERARREWMDRQARRRAVEARRRQQQQQQQQLPSAYGSTATGSANAEADAAKTSDVKREETACEWDHYVEGAPPDYLVTMLSRPGQVLSESEQQALQQLSITALQCRRNGYLCVGHADGGVTLWTPYACGRLESLCPNTSFPATLERLSGVVRAQFRHMHERIVLERQRLSLDGAIHKDLGHSARESRARMKQRIRRLLLEHHLSQLNVEEEAADDGEGRGSSDGDGAERHKDQSSSIQQPQHRSRSRSMATAPVEAVDLSCRQSKQSIVGSFERRLLRMRPLLCLLLGIGSPAELRARQLSLEDLCFLPFRMGSIASLEAFQQDCYNAAVEVAVRRLRRELAEDYVHCSGMHGGGGETFRAGLNGRDRAGVLSAIIDSEATQHRNRSRMRSVHGNACVYDMSFLQLAGMLNAPFKAPHSLGLAAFPGAVRLLLHCALEAPPSARHSNSAVSSAGDTVPMYTSGGVGTSCRDSTVAAASHSTTSTLQASTVAAAAHQAPPDGEYFEVCHAIQVAEAHAESWWEAEELQRLWTRLERHSISGHPTTGSHARTVAPLHSAHGLAKTSATPDRITRGGAQSREETDHPTSPLPPSSAVAVSEAVQRQVQRELEGRLTSLAQRAAAGALLRNISLLLRPSSRATGGGDTDEGNPISLHAARSIARVAEGSTNNFALPAPLYEHLTRGRGIAWIQASLRQQAQYAFAEPRLMWPDATAAASSTPSKGPALKPALFKRRTPTTASIAADPRCPFEMPDSSSGAAPWPTKAAKAAAATVVPGAVPSPASTPGPAPIPRVPLHSSTASEAAATPPRSSRPDSGQRPPTWCVSPLHSVDEGEGADVEEHETMQRRSSVLQSPPTTPTAREAIDEAGGTRLISPLPMPNASRHIFLTELSARGATTETSPSQPPPPAPEHKHASEADSVQPGQDRTLLLSALRAAGPSESYRDSLLSCAAVPSQRPRRTSIAYSRIAPAAPPTSHQHSYPYADVSVIPAGSIGRRTRFSSGFAPAPSLPMVPLHRTKMARTGSSRPNRSRPATADGVDGAMVTPGGRLPTAAAAAAAAAAPSWTATAAATSNDGGTASLPVWRCTDADSVRVSSARVEPASRGSKAARRPGSSGLPYTVLSLLGKSGTTK